MKIGLVDVDGHHFPNLALMKLSAWHKSKGDSVEWHEPLEPDQYDKVYMSKVFTFSPDYPWAINAKEIVRGGDRIRTISRPPRRGGIHIPRLFDIPEISVCGRVYHKGMYSEMPLVRCATQRGMDTRSKYMEEFEASRQQRFGADG